MTVADQRILRGVSASLTWQPVGQDGEPAAPTGTVTVEVTRASGSAVLAAGTATSGAGTNPRTVALTAEQVADLDLLTVTWTDGGDDSTATTLVEVVGGYYFTIAEARSADAALANDTKYPTALLVKTRQAVEEEFEAICGVAFVPRFEREITLNRKLRWAQVGRIRAVAYWSGQGYTPWTDLTYLVPSDGGRLYGLGGDRYRVDYEHGYERPPAEIKAAAITRLRHRASAALTGIPDRATSFSVAEGGTYSLDSAGPVKTGIADVDAALHRHMERSFVR